MDFVRKDSRARWKSLESVSQFGWAGSAVLGGLLSDRYDYTFTFLVTALVQSAGTLGYLLLLPLVPTDEKKLADERRGGERRSREGGGGGEAPMGEPLLGREERGSMPDVV